LQHLYREAHCGGVSWPGKYRIAQSRLQLSGGVVKTGRHKVRQHGAAAPSLPKSLR